jgi:hypothetical protein
MNRWQARVFVQPSTKSYQIATEAIVSGSSPNVAASRAVIEAFRIHADQLHGRRILSVSVRLLNLGPARSAGEPVEDEHADA